MSQVYDEAGSLNQELIRARLGDCQRDDPRALRDRMVKRWQEAYPEATAETSSVFHPLMRMAEWRKVDPDHADEIWFNDRYEVTVRRFDTDPVFGTRDGMVQLGISNSDGTARHDWRDFQEIKNQLAGPEVEAFELYPAESRLLDPSNYWTLWCFPGVRRLKVGREIHRVWDQDMSLAPQRKLAIEVQA